MKKIILLSIVLFISMRGPAQFVTMPLDYPDDGTAYMSWFTSIIDDNNVWVGTIHEGFNGYLPYSDAVRTTDGGETWEFHTIPVPGTPWIQHLGAWDANTCWYIFIDGVTYEGSIWKTADGGSSWAKVTTTQFQGGWPNAIHAFSADTVVVMGDPNGGYFEIQVTYDGGSSWTRIPQGDVPDALPGEWSTQGNLFVAENTIGFGTSKGRCVHSHDRGLHWEATQVVDEYMEFSFSDSLHGLGFRPGTSKGFFKTSDGGDTWTMKANPTEYLFGSMSNVPGINDAYVVTAFDSLNTDSLNIFYTADFFSSITMIDSNITNATNINFKSPDNGWLGGGYLWYHNIHKYTGVLSSIPGPPAETGRLSVSPNPSRDAAFVRIPLNWKGKEADLYVLDLNGKSVEHKYFKDLPEMVYMNASGIPGGIYVVHVVSAGGEALVQKWVISR